MKSLTPIATHTLAFFCGYWLAGGCEYKEEEKRTSYSDIEKRIESYEYRIRDLETQRDYDKS